MQVSLAYEMILDIAKEQAVVALLIDTMTHTLCMVKLSFRKAALLITNLACSDLLDELISGSV